MMFDGHKDSTVGERKLIWDEENRLLAVDENGFVSNYWYDADGERTVKTSGENEAIYVNSEFSGGNTGTARFSLYVSPYLVAGQGGSLKDAADLSDTGDVVDKMNVSGKELNDNNNNRFGQILSHKSIIPTKDGCVSFIPFDSSSLENIERCSNPPDDSKLIRIETPK